MAIGRSMEGREAVNRDNVAACEQDSVWNDQPYRATPPTSGNSDDTAWSPLFVTASETAPFAANMHPASADWHIESSAYIKSSDQHSRNVARTACDASQLSSSLRWWENRLRSVTEASESPGGSPGPCAATVAVHWASRCANESQMEVDATTAQVSANDHLKSSSLSPSQMSQTSDHSILMSPRGSKSFLGDADDEPDGSVSLLYRGMFTEAPASKNSGSGELDQFVTCCDYEEPLQQEAVLATPMEGCESPWRSIPDQRGDSMPEVILQPHDRGDRSPISSAASAIAVPLFPIDDPALAGPVHPGDPDPVLSGFCGPPSFWCASPGAAQMPSVSSTFVLSSNLQSSVEGHQGSMQESSVEMVAVRLIGSFEEHPKLRTRIGPALLKLLCALEGGRYSEAPVLPVHRFLPEIKVKLEPCMDTYSSSHSMHGVASQSHAAVGPTSNVTNCPTSHGPVSNVPSAAQTADILSTTSNGPFSNPAALGAQDDESPRANTYIPPPLSGHQHSQAHPSAYPSSQTTRLLHPAQSCASGRNSNSRPRSNGHLPNGSNAWNGAYSVAGLMSGEMSTRDMGPNADLSTVGTYTQGNEMPRTPTHEIGRTLPGSDCSCAFDYHLERETAASERDATDASEQHCGRGLTTRSLLDDSGMHDFLQNSRQNSRKIPGDRSEFRSRWTGDRKSYFSRDSPFFNPESLPAPLESVPCLKLHDARTLHQAACMHEGGASSRLCDIGVPVRVDIPVAKVNRGSGDDRISQNSCMPNLWHRCSLAKLSKAAPLSLPSAEASSLPRSQPRSSPRAHSDSSQLMSVAAQHAAAVAAQHPPKAPGGFARMMSCLRSGSVHEGDACASASSSKSNHSVGTHRGYGYEPPKDFPNIAAKISTPRRLKTLLMPQARKQTDVGRNSDRHPAQPSSMPLFCCAAAPPSPKLEGQGSPRGVAEGPPSTHELHRRMLPQSYGLQPALESPPSHSHYITAERTRSNEFLHAVSNALSHMHARDALNNFPSLMVPNSKEQHSMSQNMHYDPTSISTAPTALLPQARASTSGSDPSTEDSRGRGVRLYPQPAKPLVQW